MVLIKLLVSIVFAVVVLMLAFPVWGDLLLSDTSYVYYKFKKLTFRKVSNSSLIMYVYYNVHCLANVKGIKFTHNKETGEYELTFEQAEELSTENLIDWVREPFLLVKTMYKLAGFVKEKEIKKAVRIYLREISNDKYGNEERIKTLEFLLPVEEMDKINWNGITRENFCTLLQCNMLKNTINMEEVAK